MTCERCGKDITPEDGKPVLLIDALLPEIVVHERCTYDGEYANGAVREIDEQAQ